jgi:hypothetical protein
MLQQRCQTHHQAVEHVCDPFHVITLACRFRMVWEELQLPLHRTTGCNMQQLEHAN